jgi:hypothetical protein
MPVLNYVGEGVVLGVEEVLVSNPDDLMLHRAYADVLIQRSDPRGRLIETQLRLEDDKRPLEERKTLERRQRKLIKDHGRSWLGDLAVFLLDQRGIPEERQEVGAAYRFEMVRGWLHTVTAPVICPDFLRALACAPQARLLRRLVYENMTPRRLRLAGPGDASCAVIVASGILRRLAGLELCQAGITDAGARTLAECPEVRSLQLLALDGNHLSAAGEEALRAAGVRYTAQDQQPPRGE